MPHRRRKKIIDFRKKNEFIDDKRHAAQTQSSIETTDSTKHTPSVTPPEPLDPAILERLHTNLQRENATGVSESQQKHLQQIGHYLRQWRIQNGYTRQKLADKLSLQVHQLLCLENGIAETQEIPSKSFHTLYSLLNKGELDLQLSKSIQDYFTVHTK